jgi:hypothetical protein
VYPTLEIRPLTGQLEKALLFYLRGLSATAASRAAGYSSNAALRDFINSPEGEAVIQYYQEKHFDSIQLDRDVLNAMLLEAHAKAASSTEEIMAIRELGKMNDLYLDSKKGAGLNVNIQQNFNSERQLERLSNEELLELASPALKGLLEDPAPIDGEFETVPVDPDPST